MAALRDRWSRVQSSNHLICRGIPVSHGLAARLQMRMLICMQSTSVRIDSDTHSALKRIAADEHVTVGEAVRLAVRRYDQSSMGAQLVVEPREDETAWLDADLG